MNILKTANEILKGAYTEIAELKCNPTLYFNKTLNIVTKLPKRKKTLIGIACWSFLIISTIVIYKFWKIILLITGILVGLRIIRKAFNWLFDKLGSIKYNFKKQ